MAMTENEVRQLVSQVLERMQGAPAAATASWDSTQYNGRKLIGVFVYMNEAFLAAEAGYRAVRAMSVEQRETIITEIRRLTREEAGIMAKLGVEETGMGRVDHKKAKHLLVAAKTPGTEDILSAA